MKKKVIAVVLGLAVVVGLVTGGIFANRWYDKQQSTLASTQQELENTKRQLKDTQKQLSSSKDNESGLSNFSLKSYTDGYNAGYDDGQKSTYNAPSSSSFSCRSSTFLNSTYTNCY